MSEIEAKAFVDKVAEVSMAVGWQAGVGAMELAGQIVSVLHANPEHIPRFMAEGTELFLDFRKDLANGDGWFVPASCVTSLHAKTIDETIRRTQHGGSVDLIARIDGVEYRMQADWVKYLRRCPTPPTKATTP